MFKSEGNALPTPSLIISQVCKFYNVDETALRGTQKNKNIAEPRQIAMYLMRRMICMNLADIGKEFGDRDHTTVLHSLDKVEKQMRSDPAFAETVKAIKTNINSRR